jgi:hypothetical protein
MFAVPLFLNRNFRVNIIAAYALDDIPAAAGLAKDGELVHRA